MNDARQRYYAITGLVLTSLFWAGNIYISKVLIGEVSPLTLNFLRWLIVVLFAVEHLWSVGRDRI